MLPIASQEETGEGGREASRTGVGARCGAARGRRVALRAAQAGMGNKGSAARGGGAARGGSARESGKGDDARGVFVKGMSSADDVAGRLGALSLKDKGDKGDKREVGAGAPSASKGGYTLRLAKPVARAASPEESSGVVGAGGALRERTVTNETERDAGVQAPAQAFPSKKWTAEQDAQLRIAVEHNGGKNWKAIAESVPGRTHVQCLQRWKKVLQPGLIKGHWTEEEDRLLSSLVVAPAQGLTSWVAVAKHIPGRTAKQCRERYSLNLDPDINRGPWTAAEDERLLLLHGRIGNRWAEISSQMSTAGRGGVRTENAVKTRFKSLSRAAQKAWSQEEDRVIVESKLHLNNRWGSISQRLPGRSKNAVRLRWKMLASENPALLEGKTMSELADILAGDSSGEEADEAPSGNEDEEEDMPPPRPLALQASEATTATYGTRTSRGDSASSREQVQVKQEQQQQIYQVHAKQQWTPSPAPYHGESFEHNLQGFAQTPPPAQDDYSQGATFLHAGYDLPPTQGAYGNNSNYYYAAPQGAHYNYYAQHQMHMPMQQQQQQQYHHVQPNVYVEPPKDGSLRVRMRSNDSKGFSRLFEEVARDLGSEPAHFATSQSTLKQTMSSSSSMPKHVELMQKGDSFYNTAHQHPHQQQQQLQHQHPAASRFPPRHNSNISQGNIDALLSVLDDDTHSVSAPMNAGSLRGADLTVV